MDTQFIENVKAMGLLASGLWVAWTFHKLQKVRTVELENEKRIAEIAKARNEQQSQQPQLAVKLNISEWVDPNRQKGCVLAISVNLSNNGSQNLQVDFDKSTLRIAKISYEDGKTKLSEVQRFGPYYLPDKGKTARHFEYRIMRTGQSRNTVLAILPIEDRSSYLLQFKAAYYRIPFDGETERGKTTPIFAIEQEIYSTSRNTAEIDV